MTYDDVLHELDRTRWKRLQNTQFVYWPKRGAHPRIEHTNGRHRYLRSTLLVYRLALEANLLEFLKEREHALFDTEDEAVIYWRNWEVVEKPGDYKIICADYCMAHIWNDEVHDEARH